MISCCKAEDMANVNRPESTEIDRMVIQDVNVRAYKSFNKNLRQWSDTEVHFGITGASGTGKSSFINAMRGIPDDHEMAAAVGVTETTKVPTCYDHHRIPNIHFWDLPGIGTPNFTHEKYSEKVELRKYDLYIIFASCRFTENDRRLATMIRSFDKKFFFVRTKVDTDIRAGKRKETFNEDWTLNEMREDCLKNLTGLTSDENIYLISNHYTTQWDFPRLAQAIKGVQFTLKKDSLIARFQNLSVA